MRTTIDAAGRIVVPKSLRDQLGLHGGQDVLVEVRDGRLEIAPAPTDVRLESGTGGVRAVPDRDLPTLTHAQVRGTLEQVRR